eukprot:s709_g6.t1
MLQLPQDPDKAANEGYTPLIIATVNGHVEIVSLLLEASADKDLSDHEGSTPLTEASSNGRVEIAGMLIEAGANKDKAANEGFTPLIAAVVYDHVEIVRQLLEASADPDLADHEGKTPLTAASVEGLVEHVRLLLEAGASKDAADNDGRTPLIVVSVSGHVEIARLLLEAGANKDAADNEGRTPLTAAAVKIQTGVSVKGHVEIVRLLTDKSKRPTKGSAAGICTRARWHDKTALFLEASARKDIADKRLCTALTPIDAPGLGKFSVESDRSRIGRVILQMVWKKLLYFLEQGDLHNYRFLLNQQAAFFFANTDIDPIDALVPYFKSQADPFAAPLDVAVEWFLHQNGFQEPVSRDPAGWTPLCYAVMAGSPSLISALLERKADCNDRISKHKKDFMFPKGMSVLALAAYFHNTGALKVLLAARASLHACDSHRKTPLHWACISDNDTAVRELGEARADLGQHSIPGVDPLHLACAFGSLGAMTEIFGRHQRFCLQNSLHFALGNEGGSAQVISTLIQARADVNDKFHTINGLWRFIIFTQSLRHKFSPSLLTTLSYHAQGATPLLFSVITENLEAAQLLLQARAQPDIPNKRGKTPLDLASPLLAPALLAAQQGVLAAIADLAEADACAPRSDSEIELILLFRWRHGVMRSLPLFLLALVRAQRPGHKCPSLLQTGASRLARSRQGHVGPAQIPCLIHQTWKTHRLDNKSREWFATWSDKNPTCEHKLWNDTEVAALVQSTSPDLIWPIWQGLLPVERADAFRYIVLWVHGGYYADIDVSCIVPISEMPFPNETDMIVGYETGRHLTEGERDSVHFSRTDQFEQWFFASAPRNPVLLRCLELIRQKFGWRIESTEELTGPATFTDAVHEFLLTHSPDALSNLIAGRSASSGRLFPSESLYTRGNWSMWVLASGRVSSPGYSSGDDPGSPLVRHHFRGTWKPEELLRAE